MGVWSGHHIDQKTYLGWMSNAEGYSYFVNTVLPDVISGGATVGTEMGSNLGANAPLANIVMDLQARGAELGTQIPQSIMDMVANPPPPPAPTVDIPTNVADPNQSAKDILKTELGQWGLSSETDFAWGLLTTGTSQEGVVAQIRQRDPYKQRFSGLVEYNKTHPAMSEAEALSYESTMATSLKQFGIPAGAYGQQDFQRWIGEGKSVAEQTARIKVASDLSFNEPAEVRSSIDRLYGIHEGDLTHYALEGNDALPAIQKKIDAAQIAAASDRTGFGQLNAGQAERIAALTDPTQAAGELSTLAKQNALYIGVNGEGGDFSLDQVIGAFFGGDQNTQAEIRRRAAQRAAEFQGGGQTAQTQAGAYGAGKVPA